MKGLNAKWKDLPDYIIGITKEIWEDRGVGTLNHYYAPDIPVRSPMGVAVGNQATIAATMATINEFPDRELLGEDVIWSGNEDDGFLSSHRLLTKATHTRDGQFGPATGKPWVVRVIADCAVKNDTIYDEWLIRDYGGIVRQLGMDPREYAAGLIEKEGGPGNAKPAFTPAIDVQGDYKGTGNDNQWGQRYADILTRIMDKDFTAINRNLDRAVIGEYAGAQTSIGREGSMAFWVGLRSSFPNAIFKIHHQIGMDADMLSPRAAIRWSLDGVHEGWGSFGAPTGAPVHVMGMCHAEFGPWGLRREFALYDEIAVWKQILMGAA
ncbi:nuclear transport factor 2 family protein [Yoonia sediminilitoris]|uniref:SnoaL-like polyketide cyclase n=1 Tax=Yoonia sediminilitoris TaxID=1286148 RepID=A0A2T6K9A5_9RHOB|nr:ester cyclase [Yoonia sediminilitoris]PUB11343.1 SnoaL-like polyketide cyclase [Yoonia sediminilitoris]RCW91160.1 SnoaL-like polyketide cyclase [Yoonia sediminilitoris]